MTRFYPSTCVFVSQPQHHRFRLPARVGHGLLLGLFLLLVGLKAQAQKTWTGGTTNWNTASNWSPEGVPTATDNVVIPSAPANDPIVSTTVVAKSVEVQSGASLSITSAGSLSINQSKPISGSTTAFYNLGTVSNQGKLLISYGSSFAFGDYGIRNLSTITNRVGGIIAIERPTSQPNSTCFFNDGGTVDNEGQVLLGTGFNSTIPSNSSSYSIRNTGNFTNKTGGVISTDRSFVTGLFNASAGTFTNAAQINIGIVRVQTRGIENQGTFNNNTGGVITISEVRSTTFNSGIIGGLVNTGGTFTNAAQIIMGKTPTTFGNQGSGLVNQATFNNNPGGAITLDQISGAGILSLNGGNFTNAAQITIGASTTVGTAIESQGEFVSTFTNKVGGVITLDRAKTAGLVNRTANFINEGKITIGAIAAVGGLAIQNFYLLDNSGCGALINVVSDDVISEPGGAITNSGTIIENSENVSSINTNSGVVRNLNGGIFQIFKNTGLLTTTPGGAGVSVSVTANPSLTITQGQSTTLTASEATSYVWSGGQTTASISVSTAGTYSVTGTVGGCSSTTMVAVSVIKLPDLTPTLSLPQANFAATGPQATRNFILYLYEVGGLPTANGIIVVTLTAPIGYTLAFSNTQTSILVSGGSNTPVAVQNTRWQIRDNVANQQLTLAINQGEGIAANGQMILGFSLTRTSANSGSASNITVNVADDASKSYDGNSANNVYARIINGL